MSNEMKIRNLGADTMTPNAGETILIELDSEPTASEALEATKRELRQHQRSLEDANGSNLEISGLDVGEDRMDAALDILEREKQLQLDRKKEWKKEKRNKKIKRTLRMTVLIVIALILLFALLGGYRIPVPDEWVAHFQGIYQTAVDYFTGAISLKQAVS